MGKNCIECQNCIPIGEGDHFCDRVMNLVLEDYLPTIYYGGCKRLSQIAKVKKSTVNKADLKKVVVKNPVKIIVRVRKGAHL